MNRYVQIEDMNWPDISTDTTDIAWKLNHSPDSLTREDQLVAASVICAYRQIVNDTQKKRNMVCKALKDHVPTAKRVIKPEEK